MPTSKAQNPESHRSIGTQVQAFAIGKLGIDHRYLVLVIQLKPHRKKRRLPTMVNISHLITVSLNLLLRRGLALIVHEKDMTSWGLGSETLTISYLHSHSTHFAA